MCKRWKVAWKCGFFLLLLNWKQRRSQNVFAHVNIYNWLLAIDMAMRALKRCVQKKYFTSLCYLHTFSIFHCPIVSFGLEKYFFLFTSYRLLQWHWFKLLRALFVIVWTEFITHQKLDTARALHEFEKKRMILFTLTHITTLCVIYSQSANNF